MMYRNFFIFFLFVCGGVSFAMELENTRKGVEQILVNFNDPCTLCFDKLSVKKGSITTPYCGHSFHSLCYVQMVIKSKKKKCYCGARLIDFDQEGYDALTDYNKDNKSQRVGLYSTLKEIMTEVYNMPLQVILRSSLDTIYEMYETAYDQHND